MLCACFLGAPSIWERRVSGSAGLQLGKRVGGGNAELELSAPSSKKVCFPVKKFYI